MRAMRKITNALFISYALERTALMVGITRSFLGEAETRFHIRPTESDLHFHKTPKKEPRRCHMRSVDLYHFFIHRAMVSSKIYRARQKA